MVLYHRVAILKTPEATLKKIFFRSALIERPLRKVSKTHINFHGHIDFRGSKGATTFSSEVHTIYSKYIKKFHATVLVTTLIKAPTT